MTQAADDADLLAALAGIELAAAARHQAILTRALLTPAATALVTTFAQHHQAHAAAFNAALDDAGVAPVTAPGAALGAVVDPAVAAAPDAIALVQVARAIEVAVTASQLDAAGRLSSRSTAGDLARILAVDGQHLTALDAALARPVGDDVPSFAAIEGSLLDG